MLLLLDAVHHFPITPQWQEGLIPPAQNHQAEVKIHSLKLQRGDGRSW